MGQVTAIERIGGDPAIDFVNTLGGLPDDADDEYLFGYEDLLTWAVGAELLDAGAAESLRVTAGEEPDRAGEVFERALKLRGALDAVLRCRLRAEPARAEDRDLLRQEHVAALRQADLRPGPVSFFWAWDDAPATNLDRPVWPLAFHAVELLRFRPLERLARCGHCRWLFLDTSRNGSRRWCSMNACGARMKMRRYRAGHRPEGHDGEGVAAAP